MSNIAWSQSKAMQYLIPELTITISTQASGLSVLASMVLDGRDSLFSACKLEELGTMKGITSAPLPSEVADLALYLTSGSSEYNKWRTIEVYSDRPFFKYSTTETSVSASCGSFNVCRKLDKESCNPTCSYISAIDVYDKYGLQVCCSFVNFLYTAVMNETYHSRSLLVYAIASIALLDRPFAELIMSQSGDDSLESILREVCDSLIETVLELDEKQPKLAHELEIVTHDLPVEILSLIFRSRRVNKATSQHFISSRRDRTLRDGELQARAIYSSISNIGNRIFISCSGVLVVLNNKAIVCDMSSAGSILKTNNLESEDTIDNVSITISPRDNAKLTGRSEKGVFELLTSQVDLTDIRQLCLWILMMRDRNEVLQSGYDSMTKHIFNKSIENHIEIERAELLQMYEELRLDVLREQ